MKDFSDSYKVVNYLRNVDPDGGFRALVDQCYNTQNSFMQFQKAFFDYPLVRNRFMNTLFNVIIQTIYSERLYYSKFSRFKKKLDDWGIRNLFNDLAKPHQYNPIKGQYTFIKREVQPTYAAYHHLNYQKFYKSTINPEELKNAMTSWDGVNEFVQRKIAALTSSAEYDEEIAIKYLIFRALKAGGITGITIPKITEDNARTVVQTIKQISDTLIDKSDRYNLAGVRTETPKAEQILIVSAKFNSSADVFVNAAAFNRKDVEFMGDILNISTFAIYDIKRVEELFGDESDYIPITPEDNAQLEQVSAIMLDTKWLLFYNRLSEARRHDNPESLEETYFHHRWNLIQYNPFANAVAYTEMASVVNSVTITPVQNPVKKNSATQLYATVTGTGFVSQAVTWEVDSLNSDISPQGLLFVGCNEEAQSIKVTATSKVDPTKKATYTINIAADKATSSKLQKEVTK